MSRENISAKLHRYSYVSARKIDNFVMHERTKSRFLHVANGTATTMTIEAAGIPGACSIWADPLYEGPVPGDLSDGELLDVRFRYLTEPGDLEWVAWAGGDLSLDPVNDLRMWRLTIQRHDAYEELVLWFEHDLFDQLNLIQLLSWLREHLPATKPVPVYKVEVLDGVITVLAEEDANG